MVAQPLSISDKGTEEMPQVLTLFARYVWTERHAIACLIYDADLMLRSLFSLTGRPVQFQHHQEWTAPLDATTTNANVALVEAQIITDKPVGTDMWARCWLPKAWVPIYSVFTFFIFTSTLYMDLVPKVCVCLMNHFPIKKQILFKSNIFQMISNTWRAIDVHVSGKKT